MSLVGHSGVATATVLEAAALGIDDVEPASQQAGAVHETDVQLRPRARNQRDIVKQALTNTDRAPAAVRGPSRRGWTA